MGDYSRTERADHLLIVTMDRPDVLNALHPPANRELAAVFDEFQNDPELWVAIITGAGRGFSAGNDLKYHASGGDMSGQPAAGFAGLTNRFDLIKPVIAAVNGIAMGGGFEIALACDIIVASENARFAVPEPRVGLAAVAGAIHRLPRIIGTKAAMSMLLTGRQVSAQEGRELGFVSEVVPEGQALDAARRWADMILECSPLSIRATKQAVIASFEHAGADAVAEGWGLDFAVGEEHAVRYSAAQAMAASEDFIEGPKAFAEKRKPQWKGR